MPVPRQALPFGDKPALDLSKPSPPQQAPAISGETLPLQVNLMAMALPFMKGQREALETKDAGTSAPLPKVPTMTLDAYASLCAELSAQPDRRIEVLRRYRIADDAALNALHASWQKQFADQPRMQTEWQSKYQAFRDWLAQNR
jgi:hypothetical protein